MMDARDNVPVIIGAAIAVVAQLVIAPNIALFSAMPNFITVFCLLVAIVRPATAGPVLPFAMGLIADFAVGTPVGSTSLLLVLFCAIVSRAFLVLNNDTVLVPLVLLAVASLLIELLTGAFLLSFGMQADLGSAFLYRALPCGLYDCVVGLILYPLAARFLVPSSPMGPGAPAHL